MLTCYCQGKGQEGTDASVFRMTCSINRLLSAKNPDRCKKCTAASKVTDCMVCLCAAQPNVLGGAGSVHMHAREWAELPKNSCLMRAVLCSDRLNRRFLFLSRTERSRSGRRGAARRRGGDQGTLAVNLSGVRWRGAARRRRSVPVWSDQTPVGAPARPLLIQQTFFRFRSSRAFARPLKGVWHRHCDCECDTTRPAPVCSRLSPVSASVCQSVCIAVRNGEIRPPRRAFPLLRTRTVQSHDPIRSDPQLRIDSCVSLIRSDPIRCGRPIVSVRFGSGSKSDSRLPVSGRGRQVLGVDGVGGCFLLTTAKRSWATLPIVLLPVC